MKTAQAIRTFGIGASGWCVSGQAWRKLGGSILGYPQPAMSAAIDNRLSDTEERDAVALLRDLIRANSINPPGNEAGVVEVLRARAEAWGLDTQLVPVADGRPNLFVRLPGTGQAAPLVLSGHTDTVPPGELSWEHDPLSADLVDGPAGPEVWGRGAVDMKGGLAAMLAAMGALRSRGWRPRGDVLLACTVGEEADCLGAHHLVKSGALAGAQGIIIGEPTLLDVVPAHRGALWLEIKAYGKTAHGSMPHLGVNAILHLAELLRWIVGKEYAHTPHALLAPPTVNVGTIRGGIKTNVVPDYCVATVDLRSVPGQSHPQILSEVRDLAAELVSTVPGLAVEVEPINDVPPIETAVDHPLVTTAVAAVSGVRGTTPAVRGASYYTDGGIFAQLGIPTIIFGPGDDKLCHQPNERIEVAQLLAGTRGYIAILNRLLGA
ncbi:MAG: M20 family metallopeptidase [Chloroflexota bacterium]